MEATARWRIVEREGGLFVEDEGGAVIAELAVQSGRLGERERANGRLIAAAPEMLELLDPTGSNGTAVEAFGSLSLFLGKLTEGPFNCPMDQMMRITNDLHGWQGFLGEFTGRIEEVLSKVQADRQG